MWSYFWKYFLFWHFRRGLFSGPAFLIWNSDLWFRTWDTVRISQCLSLNILPHNWRQMTVFSLFLLNVLLDCVFHCWLMFFPCVMMVESQMYTLPRAAWLGSGRMGGGKETLLLGWWCCLGTIMSDSLTFSVGAGAWGSLTGWVWGCWPILGAGDLICVWFLQCFLWHNSVRLCIGTKALRLLRGIYFQSYICANFCLFLQVSVKWNKYKDIRLGWNDHFIKYNEGFPDGWQLMSGKAESFCGPKEISAIKAPFIPW